MTIELQRGYAIGRDGIVVPPGKTVREKRWDVWDDTALPSWLTLGGSGGTATFRPVTTAGQSGEVQVTNATSGANAVLTTSFAFDCTSWSSIEFHLRDVYFDTDVAGKFEVVLGLHDYPNKGVWFKEDASTFSSRYYATATTQTTLQGTFFRNKIGLGRQNIGIIMRPRSREFFLVGGDERQVLAYQRGDVAANWPSSGLIKPTFEFKPLESVSHYYRFSGASLKLVSG